MMSMFNEDDERRRTHWLWRMRDASRREDERERAVKNGGRAVVADIRQGQRTVRKEQRRQKQWKEQRNKSFRFGGEMGEGSMVRDDLTVQIVL